MKNILIIAAAFMLALSPLAAKKGKGGNKGRAPATAQSASKKSRASAEASAEAEMKTGGLTLEMRFSPDDEAVLNSYFKSGAKKAEKGLPPGLAKQGKLPPGWRKKLARGEVLPEAVFKAASPLPKTLAAKLSAPPEGVTTIIVEGKVLRIEEASLKIKDVIELNVKF